jgi:hypothetical protein
MSIELEALHKFLKNESNRDMLLLLNEKGALTYDELLDFLCMGTHMLDYRLTVLNDFLERLPNGKYVLSEKGKIAFKMLNELPESVGVSRRWKIGYGITVAFLIVNVFVGWYINAFRPSTVIVGLSSVIFGAVFLYYFKVKPIKSASFLFIYVGAIVLGPVLWFIIWGFTRAIKLQLKWYQTTGSDTSFNLFLAISLVVCCIVGGLVGEWVGKKRQYKWPRINAF